jgi:hypothetical protein
MPFTPQDFVSKWKRVTARETNVSGTLPGPVPFGKEGRKKQEGIRKKISEKVRGFGDKISTASVPVGSPKPSSWRMAGSLI